ncbi:MAG TPA: hypothetical protein VHR84_03325 [Terriglobales bacterium]|jgi:hypothetical protein|nr:hypothetical protein [Terriglobales bacterium]
MPTVPTLREQAFFELINKGQSRVQAARAVFDVSSDASARALASKVLRKFRGQSFAQLASGKGVLMPDLNKIKLEGCAVCRQELTSEYFCADPRCQALWAEFPKENESSLPWITAWRDLMGQKEKEAKEARR